jgi:Protein of unknown function, DUF547
MRIRILLGPALALLALGCALNVPLPKTSAAVPEPGDSGWARVLAAHVDDRGRIDFAGVAKAPADLDVYVAWISAVDPETSPGSFPTPDSKKAYYLNAYNALAMYNVIESGVPESLGPIKFRFFYRDRLVMGGKRISLYRLENSTVRPLGDPRIHFALNCMVRGCPRLPRVPFEASRLNEQLDGAAKLFFSEDRNVELDPAAKVVRFNEILRFYTKDFLAKSGSLIAYANLYREQKIPADWKVEFIKYDWTVNRQ